MNRSARAALLSAAMTASCAACSEPRLVGFPGMTVEEFNRKNASLGIDIDPSQSDWKGLNAPHLLVLEKDGRSIEIPVRDTGGGTQIRSTGGEHALPPPRISGFAFDMGRGYEKLADTTPTYLGYCRALERWAGVVPEPLPTAAMLEKALARHPGPLREAVVCSAEGPAIGYNITVVHYDQHRDGGDYGLAGGNGSILLRPDHSVPDAAPSQENSLPQPPVAKRTR